MLVYCVKCQSHSEHTLSVDHNEEVVLTCPACGHSVKFPTTPTPEQLAEHEKNNTKS